MAQRTIPTITSIPELAQWQAGLRNTIIRQQSPQIPANFTVVSKQGGNYCTWTKVVGADGYRLDVSEDGNFQTILTSVLLPGIEATAYFDNVPVSGGGAPKTRYYHIHSTAGTQQNPQNVLGKPSATVASTAIAPNDTVTAPVTTIDNSNRDLLNVNSSVGEYRIPGPSPSLPSL